MSPEFIALLALVITAIIAPFVANWQNNKLAIDRERRTNERQDKVAALAARAARKVTQVATKLEKSDAHTNAQLGTIVATGNATHKLMNNQRTEMLRGFSVTLRAASNANPKDMALSAAADAADKALAQNIAENSDPATKAPLADPV